MEITKNNDIITAKGVNLPQESIKELRDAIYKLNINGKTSHTVLSITFVSGISFTVSEIDELAEYGNESLKINLGE